MMKTTIAVIVGLGLAARLPIAAASAPAPAAGPADRPHRLLVLSDIENEPDDTQSFVRLLAPIASFTAEEAWQVLGGNAEGSVMFQLWHELPKVEGEGDLLARWALVRAARADVTKALEAQREAGKIGSALQAAVEIRCAGEKFDALAALGDDLKFVLICSSTALVHGDTEQVIATPLDYAKCERCWHVRADVGANTEHPGLCGRCDSNLHGEGEARACA